MFVTYLTGQEFMFNQVALGKLKEDKLTNRPRAFATSGHGYHPGQAVELQVRAGSCVMITLGSSTSVRLCSLSQRAWFALSMDVSRLIVLREAGVGAIYLGNIDTEYHLKDHENNLQGKIRESSVFLRENGKAGIIHEIDIKM